MPRCPGSRFGDLKELRHAREGLSDQAKFPNYGGCHKAHNFLVQNLKRVGRDFILPVPETFADGRKVAAVNGQDEARADWLDGSGTRRASILAG